MDLPRKVVGARARIAQGLAPCNAHAIARLRFDPTKKPEHSIDLVDARLERRVIAPSDVRVQSVFLDVVELLPKSSLGCLRQRRPGTRNAEPRDEASLSALLDPKL